MWRWDQGRIAYYQFDALQAIARFVLAKDFKKATQAESAVATGLPFSPAAYKFPWRNYSRTVKVALLISEWGGVAQPTSLAALLAVPGQVTCDEYFLFLASSFTDPSPALSNWGPGATRRYPLLFSLRYLLACNIASRSTIAIPEIVGAYVRSAFVGGEPSADFISLAGESSKNAAAFPGSDESRQARESLRVISQITFLHSSARLMSISLNPAEAATLLDKLSPIGGAVASSPDAEIRRLADAFVKKTAWTVPELSEVTGPEFVVSGFREGNKVHRTHLRIERNPKLREAFFKAHPDAPCNVCEMDTTSTYPWTTRVLDLHHLLPLASAARVADKGTTLDDIVAVCPSCHRAIHRYYNDWLANAGKEDFANIMEAAAIYAEMKKKFTGIIHA